MYPFYWTSSERGILCNTVTNSNKMSLTIHASTTHQFFSIVLNNYLNNIKNQRSECHPLKSLVLFSLRFIPIKY